jgi:HEAT repeat protein
VRLAVKAGVLKLALAAPPAPPADADAALNAALADSDPRVRAAAAATAPYICLAACDAARQQAALTRMKDILEQLGADSSLLVLRSVAASLGPTLCLAAHALDATHPSPATHPPSVSAFSSYTSNIAAELAAAAAAAIASTVTISGSTRSASTDAHDWCAACDQADALAHGHASSSTSSSSSSSHPPVSSTDASGGSAGARLAQACWQLAVRLLTHDEELVKAACLGSLGRMATHAALAPPDRDRVGEAATPISTSLSEQPAREAAMHMVVAHLAHESPDIRHAAGEALVRLAQPRALEALYGVQRGEEMEQHAVLHGIRGVIEEARVMGDGSVRTAAVALLERVGVGGGSGDGGVRASSNRTIIVMITAVQRLDDPDWSVRAAALDLIASLARRCGLSVLGLVMDTKQLLMYLGLQLIARPLLTVVLAEALCGCTQQELLVYVLSSALPTLVAKKVHVASLARLLHSNLGVKAILFPTAKLACLSPSLVRRSSRFGNDVKEQQLSVN